MSIVFRSHWGIQLHFSVQLPWYINLHVGFCLLQWHYSILFLRKEQILYTLLPLTNLKNPASKTNTFVIKHVAFTSSHSRTQPSWCKRDGRTCDCPSCMPCRILHGYGTLRLGKWDTVHVGYVYTRIYVYIYIEYYTYYNMVFPMFSDQVSTSIIAGW